MICKIKRQQQINKISKKKGHYIFQDQVTIIEKKQMKDKVIEDQSKEEAVKKLIENENLEDIISDNDTVEDWSEKDFKAFKEIGKRFINEALHWHKDTTSSIRIIYTGDSRITLQKNEKKKAELEEHAKGIKKINTFFKLTSRSIRLSKPISINIKTDLYICLEKLNQLYSIGKSKKENHNIFIYDYVRLLSVRQYTQKLLNGEGKMTASSQIAQVM